MAHEFEALSGQILEAAVDVHRSLGPGFLEGVYENALAVAFDRRGIRYQRQCEVRIWFEDQEVGVHRLDLLVDGRIVVEIKAVKALDDIHFAQLRSYLKATGLHVGLLLNFNAPALVAKRACDPPFPFVLSSFRVFVISWRRGVQRASENTKARKHEGKARMGRAFEAFGREASHPVIRLSASCFRPVVFS